MSNGQILAAQQGPPQLTVATPLNDVQLVALVAAQIREDDPKEAVGKAVEIVALSCVLVQRGAIQRRAKEIIAEIQAERNPT